MTLHDWKVLVTVAIFLLFLVVAANIIVIWSAAWFIAVLTGAFCG